VQAAWHAARGLALAGLGRKSEAVVEGQRAATLIPTAKDAFEGPYWQVYLARIHAMNGEPAPAVALLRANIQEHVGLDPPALLRLDPLWDPIRKDPAFAALAAGK
jgi:serine/threonine-protein kinase